MHVVGSAKSDHPERVQSRVIDGVILRFQDRRESDGLDKMNVGSDKAGVDGSACSERGSHVGPEKGGVEDVKEAAGANEGVDGFCVEVFCNEWVNLFVEIQNGCHEEERNE